MTEPIKDVPDTHLDWMEAHRCPHPRLFEGICAKSGLQGCGDPYCEAREARAILRDVEE